MFSQWQSTKTLSRDDIGECRRQRSGDPYGSKSRWFLMNKWVYKAFAMFFNCLLEGFWHEYRRGFSRTLFLQDEFLYFPCRLSDKDDRLGVLCAFSGKFTKVAPLVISTGNEYYRRLKGSNGGEGRFRGGRLLVI